MAYKETLKHHDAVSKELSEYYRMYMQSWSIVATGIFVGVLYALREPNAPLERPLVAALPLIFLFWFVLTGWFWAKFALYRRYLTELEEQMATIADATAPLPTLYRNHVTPTHMSGWQRWTHRLAIVIGALMYGPLSFVAAPHATAYVSCSSTAVLFIAYLALAALSLFYVFKLASNPKSGKKP